jgi:hypothetical protein
LRDFGSLDNLSLFVCSVCADGELGSGSVEAVTHLTLPGPNALSGQARLAHDESLVLIAEPRQLLGEHRHALTYDFRWAS